MLTWPKAVRWRTQAQYDHWDTTGTAREGSLMAKKSRKRKARAKSKANHGKRPNA